MDTVNFIIYMLVAFWAGFISAGIMFFWNHSVKRARERDRRVQAMLDEEPKSSMFYDEWA